MREIRIGRFRLKGEPYLIEDFKNRVVTTNCGDSYLDYDIPFDELFELVDYIKKTEKEMKEGK